MPDSALATCIIAAIAIAGVIIRPWKLPEAVWAVSGAMALLLSGLLSWQAGLTAIGKGNDVYLFLTGMMILSEVARREGVFDKIAALAAQIAGGSGVKLFFLIYAAGTIVTIFMSNDATAVVLTPAVFAVAKAVRAKPLPYLYICAFIANAASFVLPISNPANLVVFGSHMPTLAEWIARFALPSLISVTLTCTLLYITQRKALTKNVEHNVGMPMLSSSGVMAASGIVLTACVLMFASWNGTPLGLPTLICSSFVALGIMLQKREMPWPILKAVSWSVLPLVAGLFVLVEALNHVGAVALLGKALEQSSSVKVGIATAFICNGLNNLPAGLIAGMAATQTHLSDSMTSALLIGIDLGPNLSITGSLATILWLKALRREGLNVTAWQFLKLGIIIMPVTVIATLFSSG